MIRRTIRFLGISIGAAFAGLFVLGFGAQAVTSPDFGGYVMLASIAALAVMVYFLPTLVAKKRNLAVGTELILFINAMIGWTVIGWVVCLMWAALGESNHRVASYAR